ncbi:hypothetical protein GCM10027360_63690 [Amycolatopsis echigonensis]
MLVRKPLLLVARRVDWRGTGRLAETGGAVPAVSPVSRTDPLFPAEMILDQRAGPPVIAKTSPFQSRAVGWWFRPAGHVEVDRSNSRAGLRAAVEAVDRAPSSSTRKDRSRSGRREV